MEAGPSRMRRASQELRDLAKITQSFRPGGEGTRDTLIAPVVSFDRIKLVDWLPTSTNATAASVTNRDFAASK
jgi:hypothetical protein